MSLDPFRNDHRLQRRDKPQGEGPVIRGFQLAGLALLAVLCVGVVGPILVLTYNSVTSGAEPEGDIPGKIANVHAMGVNPKDGALFAATNRGLYLVKGLNEGLRIGGSYQDNRGFTVIGPDRFISSGRPDIRDLISDFEPEMMGFQLSTDAGQKWRSVSLKGQATFLSLAQSGDVIYGYESKQGAFMVSRNEGRSWQTLSTPPALLDLAISPTDSLTLIALTEDGALRTSNGGASWQPAPVPGLIAVEWQGSVVWGMDVEGGLYQSADGGGSWELTGAMPGPSTALLVIGDALYAAVKDSGIFVSKDAGQTWTPLYLLPEQP